MSFLLHANISIKQVPLKTFEFALFIVSFYPNCLHRAKTVSIDHLNKLWRVPLFNKTVVKFDYNTK